MKLFADVERISACHAKSGNTAKSACVEALAHLQPHCASISPDNNTMQSANFRRQTSLHDVELLESQMAELALRLAHSVAQVSQLRDSRTSCKQEFERQKTQQAQYLSKLSHSLRTTMNGINGMVDLLAREELTPRQAEYSDIIAQSSKDLIEAISTLDQFIRYDLNPPPTPIASAPVATASVASAPVASASVATAPASPAAKGVPTVRPRLPYNSSGPTNPTNAAAAAGNNAELVDRAPGQVFKLVLVAEDNQVNQRVAMLQLAEMGIHADIVSNGREAVEAAARIEYDAILMDCQMPALNGLEAASEIRRLEQMTDVSDAGENAADGALQTDFSGRTRRHVPIIALTASALNDDREKCIAAGMDDYLSKPVTQDALERVLGKFIAAAEASAAADEVQELLPAPATTKTTDTPDAPDAPDKIGKLLPGRDAGFKSNTPVNNAYTPPSDAKPQRAVMSFDPANSAPLNLDPLQEAIGPEGVREILDIFLVSTSELLTKVEEAYQKRDKEQLQAVAHELRGSTASMGANAMADASRKLEAAAQADDWSAVPQLQQDLAAALEAARRYIAKY